MLYACRSRRYVVQMFVIYRPTALYMKYATTDLGNGQKKLTLCLSIEVEAYISPYLSILLLVFLSSTIGAKLRRTLSFTAPTLTLLC